VALSSVVDQKFALSFPRVHRANFRSINDTRIISLLVSLSNPKFALSALQSIANFGFGTLVFGSEGSRWERPQAGYWLRA
jgi:hypothetical protein